MDATPTRHDTQLLKGVLDLILLRMLAERESYGYEIVTSIHRLGLGAVQDGTVYPALNRLQREGYVTSHLLASSSGPARKYYRLTEAGHGFTLELERSWQRLVSLVSPLLVPPMPHAPKEATP